MDEKTAFCENCRKEVLYTTKKRLGKFVCNSGQRHVYEEVTAICSFCKKYVCVSEINDVNLENLNKVIGRN